MARPRVLLNCACSLDGKLAAPGGAPLRLSCEEDLRRVHAMRAACDAILVGVGTVLADDPALRVKARHAQGPDPLRVVLDSRGRTPQGARVVDGSAATWICTEPGVRGRWPQAEQVQVPGKDGLLDLATVLDRLGGRGVGTVMVEGGGRVLRSFLESGLVDAWTLYVAPVLVGGDAPSVWPGAAMRRLRLEKSAQLGEGVLLHLRPPRATEDAGPG